MEKKTTNGIWSARITGKEIMHEVKSSYTKAADTSYKTLERLRDGAHDAFNEIYLSYSDSLQDFLTALLRQRAEAEEITQNIFMNLWERRGEIDPSQGIKRYLFRLAKFHAFDYFDHEKVVARYTQHHLRIDDAEADISVDDILAGKELEKVIQTVIERMPEKRKEIFLLSRNEGLTHEQIANKLGISRNTVKNHIVTAVNELKEVIMLFIILFLV